MSRLFIIVLSQYLSIIAIWCVRVIISVSVLDKWLQLLANYTDWCMASNGGHYHTLSPVSLHIEGGKISPTANLQTASQA